MAILNWTEKKTGEVYRIEPSDYLTPRQTNKMLTHPDMIWQFVQHIKEIWREKGVDEVEIYANIKVRLNGRSGRPFIDPEADLSKVEWETFKSADWIMPFAGEDDKEEKSKK